MRLPPRLNETGPQGKLAAAINTLSDAIRSLQLRKGTGIKLTETENGTTIELDAGALGETTDGVPRWQ